MLFSGYSAPRPVFLSAVSPSLLNPTLRECLRARAQVNPTVSLNQLSPGASEHNDDVLTPSLFSNETRAIVGGTFTSPAEHGCLPSFPAGSGGSANRITYPRQDFAYAALEEFEKEVKNQWRTPVMFNESLDPSAGSAQPALDIIEPAPNLIQRTTLTNEAGVAIPSDTRMNAFSPPNQDTEFVSVNLNIHDMPAIQGVNVEAEAIDDIAREGEYTSSEHPNTQDDEFAIVGGTLTSPAEHDCLPSFPAGWGSTANRLIYPCQDFAYAALEEFEKEVKNQWRTPVMYNESLDPSAGSAHPALDIIEPAPSLVQPTALANEAGVAIPSDSPTKAFSPPNKDTEFVSVNINTHDMPVVQGINVEVEAIDDFIIIAREGEYTSSEQPNTQDDEFEWFEIDA